jgi:hypothetical protein
VLPFLRQLVVGFSLLRVLFSWENESVECECVMKEEVTTILDAMRAAQAELADYLVSADRNAS